MSTDSSAPRKPNGLLMAALALILIAGLGVWILSRSSSNKPQETAAVKRMAPGKLLSVEPLTGYEPKLSEVESRLLHDGPDTNDKAAVKAYLLAKAKLESDPVIRTQLEQEAVAFTDGYGNTPPVSERNAQVDSMIEALKTGKHPERLNPLVAPKPFDAMAYKAAPSAYLDVAEPGRVFQSKPAAEGVARIQPVSPYFQNVRQGESIELAVKAVPGYPVTFTSFDCGAFDNGLTTKTVEADAAGVARVRFRGMPGTVLESNILASSPVTTGQVRFKTNTLVHIAGN